LELLFVGPPVSGEYLARVEALGAGLSCRWLPAQPDVAQLLHAADVVVVPSLWDEPFGRVAIEGLATGRPVLASRSGGLGEILTGDLERFLHTRGDAAELASAIDSLAHWRRDEPGLADLCAGHVRQHFQISHAIDRVEAELARAARLSK
jgi:glycosyltransferase involved in cell wall biosynthesis